MKSDAKRSAKLLAILTIAVFILPAARGQGAQIRVAAAADLTYVLADLKPVYESQTHNKLQIVYGSSGNFYSQIQNGAPFDVFLSADLEYPRKLRTAGLVDAGTFYRYAVGEIAIWAPENSRLDLGGRTWKALLDPQVRKIAIANPEHAPYGSAAVAALRKAGIYDQMRSKLVYGENISQAAQFVQSGNAQAGILALSLVLSGPMKSGEHWEVPGDMHAPLEQAVVVLKRSHDVKAARGFLEFLKSDTARLKFIDYGFTFPVPAKTLAPAARQH
jgi:molybdate transport system substrate-binding protein